MLSILVPIYNFDCTTLVNSLNGQASKIDVPVEILCIDDNSNLSTQQKNSTLASLEYVDYQVLEENIGRSKIRNLLAEKANHKYLLYLDCDSEIINDDYISKYLDHINENEVIYGGRSYRNEKPKEKKHYLRWHYGRRREFKLSTNRNGAPYRYFMTNNFLIPKAIYQKIKSYEKLQGYGHEDTLFAIDLKRNNISIRHIDNFLNHIGLEDSSEFVLKTENGVKNLALLVSENRIDDQIKLYRFYKRVKAMKLVHFVNAVYNLLEPIIIRYLNTSRPNLLVFDFYKLGLLTRYLKKT